MVKLKVMWDRSHKIYIEGGEDCVPATLVDFINDTVTYAMIITEDGLFHQVPYAKLKFVDYAIADLL